MTTDALARALYREKRRRYLRDYLPRWRAAHPGYHAAEMRARYIPAAQRQPGEGRYRRKGAA